MINGYLSLIIKSTVAAQNSVDMVNSTHGIHSRPINEFSDGNPNPTWKLGMPFRQANPRKSNRRGGDLGILGR
jgi:hypothetical protein